MKQFQNMGAQGDMLIRRVEAVPADAKRIEPEQENFRVLTHSETGAHHTAVLDRPDGTHGDLAEAGVERFQDSMNVLRSFLVVPPGKTVKVVHQRPHDTHEEVSFGAGVWEVIRQREYDITQSAGWRMAAD
jgi:hypothetical protein